VLGHEARDAVPDRVDAVRRHELPADDLVAVEAWVADLEGLMGLRADEVIEKPALHALLRRGGGPSLHRTAFFRAVEVSSAPDAARSMAFS
jgi:hypothetical protein